MPSAQKRCVTLTPSTSKPRPGAIHWGNTFARIAVISMLHMHSLSTPSVLAALFMKVAHSASMFPNIAFLPFVPAISRKTALFILGCTRTALGPIRSSLVSCDRMLSNVR